MMKNLILFLLLGITFTINAGDLYNPSSGLVLIPDVRVGQSHYRVQMNRQGGSLFIVNSVVPISSTMLFPDSYDPVSGILHMPNVSIDGDNFDVIMRDTGNLVFQVESSTQVNFKFSIDYLNGKTLYNAYFSSSDNIWKIETFTFTETTSSSFTNGVLFSNVDNVPYSISPEGYLVISFPQFPEPDYIKATGTSDDYLILNWTDLENINQPPDYTEFFYFDLEKAETFIDIQNSNL